MLQYTLRKLIHTAFDALGVVTLVFVALRISGDPAATMLPGDASVDELTALRRVLGLDQPLPVQYVQFLAGAVSGDFGTSFRRPPSTGWSGSLTVPATRTVTFWINTTLPPTADRRVRQAMHYAIDVQSIVKNLYADQGKPFSGGLADTDFGHNPALKPYPYDPERAKNLLAEAGHGGGIDLTLYAGSGTMVNDKQLLEAMADMWSKVNIRARIEMMEMAARQKMNNERTVPPNGLMLINPQSTLLDADGSLWRLFHPSGFGGKYWIGSQPGQRFHALMEEARSTLDTRRRKALYTEATQIIHDEKPWLELFQEVIIYGVGKRLSFTPRPDYRLIVAEMVVGR